MISSDVRALPKDLEVLQEALRMAASREGPYPSSAKALDSTYQIHIVEEQCSVMRFESLGKE